MTDLISQRKAAEILGVSHVTLGTWRREGLPFDLGRIDPVQFVNGDPNRPLFDKAEIELRAFQIKRERERRSKTALA